jgi:hypothetical protein
MKNMKYDHFERNRYFLGKLLSVSDFETEQRYFNNKRRFINRLMHGTGIICGLSVNRINEETFSVDAGAALDHTGREICISAPITQKLSALDGFTADPANQTLYLCLEYQETDIEPVHSLTAATGQTTESAEYSKYAEGFRFYLTQERPENAVLAANQLHRQTVLVYEDPQLRVTQSMDRFLRPAQKSHITVVVEKQPEAESIQFHYALQSLTLKDAQGKTPIFVDFDETGLPKQTVYVFQVPFQVDVFQDATDTVSFLNQNLTLSVGGNETQHAVSAVSPIVISHKSAEDQLVAAYFSQSLEERLLNTDRQRLYLAAITVSPQDNGCAIRHITGNPFQQNLPTNRLLKMLQEQKEGLNPFAQAPKPAETPAETSQETGFESFKSDGWCSTGVEVLNLGANTQKDNHMFSKEIIHGLGKGPVFIVLGLEETREIQGDIPYYGDHMVFGNQDVFLRSSLEKAVPLVSLGALANSAKGAFQIGVKLLKNTEHTSCRVRWWAYKHAQDIDASYFTGNTQASVSLSPDIAQLTFNETIRFEVIFKNAQPGPCVFSVKEPDGGSIDPNGVYTAPAHEGLFEIQAESAADPALRTSAFAVVKGRS